MSLLIPRPAFASCSKWTSESQAFIYFPSTHSYISGSKNLLPDFHPYRSGLRGLMLLFLCVMQSRAPLWRRNLSQRHRGSSNLQIFCVKPTLPVASSGNRFFSPGEVHTHSWNRFSDSLIEAFRPLFAAMVVFPCGAIETLVGALDATTGSNLCKLLHSQSLALVTAVFRLSAPCQAQQRGFYLLAVCCS